MKRILIVKVTSLGDVVQTLPVVADLHRAFPGVEVDWAVDESCADVVRWSAGVSRVLCAPLRRFKKARSVADLKAIAESIGELRRYRYDAVIDLHGVYKSAIIAFLARARERYGYRNPDLGERGAMFAYSGRFGPRPACDAWHGMRVSAGEALGYEPQGPADYWLVPPTLDDAAQVEPDAARPYALFFHATSNDDKRWPTGDWAELARERLAGGMRVLLPWGSASEHEEAQRIALRAPGAEVMPRQSVTELAARIAGAALVVGVDTGFVHMAHAFKRPTVMIFVATSRHHCGIAGAPHSLSIGETGVMPSVDDVLDAIAQVRPEPNLVRYRMAAF
ncbi:lipopolysaccharide heptosyltransferase I [Burkholderia sp. FERM BP-3421]|jgi:heptosyltransferase-1|uniref:lipopolysaccharide heptosyltransferase I n=1 Tax=Burkholderia sp. FERM BP-3421 TaxID=1494466 RepID=UPI00236079B0|nr:lipopolysaccharide heptosyltransferase I [Burkholderia sp. FERM BP-3421]WDD93314.1 lipopolysaccharide heptosyltransferase I [Burkholderia sp. FERM BP-3421]